MSQDDPEIRKRVKIAVGLLVGAKVLNAVVPFTFKYAVDMLNAHSVATTGTAVMGLTTAPATVATVATSLLLGCKNLDVSFIPPGYFGVVTKELAIRPRRIILG